jgi:hypothetical protein
MGAAKRNRSYHVVKSEFSSSSETEDNIMLNDTLNHAECLYDNDVLGKLSDRHKNFECFLQELFHCAPQIFFATQRGFAGYAAYDLRHSFLESWHGKPSKDHSILKDDIVVVPRGSSMPWVLRATDVDGEYKLIIDCFVQGIMEGESMALAESGQLQTQSFTLV